MSDPQERIAPLPADAVCACALCREPRLRTQDIMGHDVYKLGDLQYTELAHRTCVETHPDAADYSWE